MWTYTKALEYPIKIKCANPRLAKFIISTDNKEPEQIVDEILGVL